MKTYENLEKSKSIVGAKTVLHAIKKESFFRFRRLRQKNWARDLMCEVQLTPHDLIWPLFVREDHIPAEISQLPGVRRHAVNELDQILDEACAAGIRAVALFPHVPQEKKDVAGQEAFFEGNLICKALAKVKDRSNDIGLICDVALDPYTTHGHDGIVKEGDVDTELTLEALREQALVLAEAGAQCLAPSDMMDGRVAVIRKSLDEAGHSGLPIMAYSAKFASSFYGPFRSALGSDKNLGLADKKTYQLNPANGREALREAVVDAEEGADALIVKPGMMYLDVLQEVVAATGLPTFSYHVSGEYAMLKAAAQAGILDEMKALLEVLLCCKRAGASGIWTYGALDAAKEIKHGL